MISISRQHRVSLPVGSVALIQFVIRVDTYVTNGRLPLELYVHQVRQLPVRLPVRFRDVIAKLVHAESRFTTGQAPDRVVPDLSYSASQLLLYGIYFPCEQTSFTYKISQCNLSLEKLIRSIV